jgi:four helix bundle protein
LSHVCKNIQENRKSEKVKKKVESFEDLYIWQEAIEFCKAIYLVTDKNGLRGDFGLKDQMRRSSVSIPSNIAEGFERRSRKEYLNFLNISKGSAGEIRTQLFIAFQVGYLEEMEHEILREKAKFLSGSISNHMKSILDADC